MELGYAYDANDDRVLKTAVDPLGREVHTAYISDSLELRRAPFVDGDYALTRDTEAVYLWANGVRLARLLFADEDVSAAMSGTQRVLLEIADHLGSSSIVVDRDTGELVERATYSAYGGAESDYRPVRWGSYREAYRFTGKEDDGEVGLTYFGKRYYAPGLGRWISADPLSVHQGGDDLNPYAYVHGRVFAVVDANGLMSFWTGAAIVAGIGVGIAAGVATGGLGFVAAGAIAGAAGSVTTAGVSGVGNGGWGQLGSKAFWGSVGIAALSGAAAGAVGGAFADWGAKAGMDVGTALGGSSLATYAHLGAAMASITGGAAAGVVGGQLGRVLAGDDDSVSGGKLADDAAMGALGGLAGYGYQAAAGNVYVPKGYDSLQDAAVAAGHDYWAAAMKAGHVSPEIGWKYYKLGDKYYYTEGVLSAESGMVKDVSMLWQPSGATPAGVGHTHPFRGGGGVQQVIDGETIVEPFSERKGDLDYADSLGLPITVATPSNHVGMYYPKSAVPHYFKVPGLTSPPARPPQVVSP